MSLNGTWKQVNCENAMEFAVASGTAEEMAKMANVQITLTYKIEGNNITTTRVYTSAGKKKLEKIL